MRARRSGAVLVVIVSACGARTDLGHRVEGEPIDASFDSPKDARPHDAPSDVIVLPDGPGTACSLGPNIQYPTNDCSGDQVDWVATPYTPPSDILVQQMEAYMTHGNVALLTSTGGAPDQVLFVGSVGSSTLKAWLGTTVSPPVLLQGGTQYFIGFQGDCSFTQGPSPVEYMAGPSVNGPWHNQGSDPWAARLIGTCY